MRLLLSFALAVSMVACSSASDTPTKSMDPMKQLEAAGINKRNYRLKYDVNFANGERSEHVALAGTKFETKIENYSYSFVNNVSVSLEEADRSSVSCSIFIAQKIGSRGGLIFGKGEKLLTGQYEPSSENNNVSFILQLQEPGYRNVFLSCRNVTSVEEIKAHIGHLIEIN